MADKFVRAHLAQAARTDENVHETDKLVGKPAAGTRQGLSAALPPASHCEPAASAKTVSSSQCAILLSVKDLAHCPLACRLLLHSSLPALPSQAGKSYVHTTILAHTLSSLSFLFL